MVLAALIIIWIPIFAIVAVWTKLIQKLWVKIALTIASVLTLVLFLALWSNYGELEDCEIGRDAIIDVMYEYSYCVEDSVDADNFDSFVDCGLDLYEFING